MRRFHEKLSYVTAELYETPKEIPDLPFAVDDPVRGKDWVARLKAIGAKETATYEGYSIWAADNYFFTEKDGQLSYFVKWEERAMPGQRGQYVTQIAVERNPTLTPPGLSSYVFWNFLFPKHGAVMTDNAQTRLGRNFWRNQVFLAFKNGVLVYFVNLADQTARQVLSGADYANASGEAYGRTERHKDLRLLITKSPPSGLAIKEAATPVVAPLVFG